LSIRARLRRAVVSRPALLDSVRSARFLGAKVAIIVCGPYALSRALDGSLDQHAVTSGDGATASHGGNTEPGVLPAIVAESGHAFTELGRDLELYALRATCDRAVARAEEERAARLAAEAKLARLGVEPD
jgi:hypothetical protein